MPPGESHVSRISREYYVNYFNSFHRELGPACGLMTKILRYVVLTGGPLGPLVPRCPLDPVFPRCPLWPRLPRHSLEHCQ